MIMDSPGMTLIVCGTYKEYNRLRREFDLEDDYAAVAWMGPGSMLAGRFTREDTRIIFGYVPDGVDMSEQYDMLKSRGLMT